MAALENLTIWQKIITDCVREDSPDLSMRQWAIMVTVYMKPGPHTVRGLSRSLNVPKPAISRALDALSILGFIRRARDPNDRRIAIIQKTPEGAIFLDEFSRLVDLHSGFAGLGTRYA